MDNSKKNVAVLFDFDGVVVDTETQYSVFWHRVGMDYLGMPDLEGRIKGQTLTYIYKAFFPDMTDKQAEITAALDRFEQEMEYPFIPGVLDFMDDLRRHGCRAAGASRSGQPLRPDPDGRDVHCLETCARLLPVGHASAWFRTCRHMGV